CRRKSHGARWLLDVWLGRRGRTRTVLADSGQRNFRKLPDDSGNGVVDFKPDKSAREPRHGIWTGLGVYSISTYAECQFAAEHTGHHRGRRNWRNQAWHLYRR